MDGPPIEYVFPEPWRDLRGDDPQAPATRDRLRQELLVELGPDDALNDSRPEAVAAFTRQDEVLFTLSGTGFAIVHLTYAGRRDSFVKVRMYDRWPAAKAEVEAMANDW